MYPNIETVQCIQHLSNYLSDPKTSSKFGFSSEALLEAFKLVMHNNRMRFGNVIMKQMSGIEMEMSPAQTVANLFVAMYEKAHVLQYVPQAVLYLHHLIDDGIGIWLHNTDLIVDKNYWKEFQTCLNNIGLKWVFSERSDEMVFMDLWLKKKGRR